MKKEAWVKLLEIEKQDESNAITGCFEITLLDY
jgi:hypothetical protein